jgi:hypothetical protein
MRGALDFKVKDCPVCAVMKNKRPKKPTAVLIEEKRQWKPWEKVFSDSSGKFKGDVFARKSLLQRLRLRSLWTEALFRSQEEVTLSYGVLEILG